MSRCFQPSLWGNTEVSVPVLDYILFARAGREAWQHLPGKGGEWAAECALSSFGQLVSCTQLGIVLPLFPCNFSNNLGDRDGFSYCTQEENESEGKKFYYSFA